MKRNRKATAEKNDQGRHQLKLWVLVCTIVGLADFAFGQQWDVLEPLPNKVSGMYYDSVLVEFFNQTAGAEIYYTLNGDTPSTSSSRYTSPFYLKETCTVKAVAVKNGVSSRVHPVSYYVVPKSSGSILPSDKDLLYAGIKVFYSLTGRRSHKPSTKSVLIEEKKSIALSF